MVQHWETTTSTRFVTMLIFTSTLLVICFRVSSTLAIVKDENSKNTHGNRWALSNKCMHMYTRVWNCWDRVTSIETPSQDIQGLHVSIHMSQIQGIASSVRRSVVSGFFGTTHARPEGGATS